MHVLTESNVYAFAYACTVMVSVSSYCIVFDAVVEDIQAAGFSDRPGYVGNKPKTDANELLMIHSEFDIDKDVDNTLLISAALDWYLKSLLIKKFKSPHYVQL